MVNKATDSNIEMQLKKGEALFSEGKIDEAEALFLSLLENEPDNSHILNNIGVIYHLKGSLNLAEDYLLKALRVDENHLDALSNLANVYIGLKRWKEAALKLERYTSIEDQNADIFLQLGTIYDVLGEKEKTEDAWKRSLEIDPNQRLPQDVLSERRSEPENSADKDLSDNTNFEQNEKSRISKTDFEEREYYRASNFPIRVLFAPVEIANNSVNFSETLKDFNIEVDVLNVFAPNHLQKNNTTLKSEMIQKLQDDPVKTIVKIARKYDLIYFQFGSTFLDREYIGGPKLNYPYPDLSIIRNEGCNIASAYWGSDIWDPSMFVYCWLRGLGYDNLEKAPFSSREHLKRIEVMSRYSSFVLSPDESKHFFPKLVDGETPINLENWPYRERLFDRKLLKVAHMPSDRFKKNSDIILKTFEKLREEEIAEPVLIENMPQNEVKNVLEGCDILVDQFVWGFGKASVEAMALGIPVIIRRDEPLKGRRSNAPVFVVANKDELKKKIKDLNGERELLRVASRKGREYVENFHERKKAASVLADYMTSAVKEKPIPHLTTSSNERYAIFDTKFYEQALPLLLETGDLQRTLITCLSGINNHVSLELCYQYLDMLNGQNK
jgi:tetratricopeptide (TPR) repeat protein